MLRNSCVYCEYYSLEHLKYIDKGWKEQHCLYVDGLVFIKLVKP